jgi:hypothetical protein
MEDKMVQLPLGFLLKHLVPILFVFEEDGQQRAFVVTAFVLSVGDQWFLVTAGHCIGEVNDYISSLGWKLKRCCLLDSCHLGVGSFDGVPFIYDDADWVRTDKQDIGLDYGILVLPPYYRSLLEKNGIQALSEEAWSSPPNDPDCYFLLGIPKELVEVDLDAECAKIVPVLYGVERLHKQPEGFKETQVPRFYGRIRLDEAMTSIKGVSGGPIFAFQQDEQARLRYWLVALQSRWLNQSYRIAACPTRILGQALAVWYETPNDTGATAS